MVTLSYILTPEGVESETTDKSKHVAFVFQGLDYRTQLLPFLGLVHLPGKFMI